jgi:hypothetical protein
LAAGGKARGLQDLIDTVTGGEIQGAQNKQSALGEIAKLISGGEVDYQKLQMQLGDSALDRKMKIFGFMADQQAAQAKAAADAAANNPYQETTTDTYENQPFWESMQAATAGDPVAAALLKTTNDRAGSSPTKMQELLSELSSPQVKSPFGSSFLNTISNLGKPLVSPQSMAESQAAQKLLQAYQNYGGFGGAPTTTRKVTYKT